MCAWDLVPLRSTRPIAADVMRGKKVPMLKKYILISTLALTTSCGDTNNIEEETPSLYDLSGTWFSEKIASDGSIKWTGERVIRDSGKKVSIVHCNKQEVKLVESEDNLFDVSGGLYYLQIEDSDTLIGTDDFGNTLKVIKKLERTHYDSGTFQFTMEGYDDTNASVDVCAHLGNGRYGSVSGNEISGKSLTLSAPYKNSFISLDIDFRELAVGDYSIASDLNEFVEIDSKHALMDIDSPELIKDKDRDFVLIISGTITIQEYENDKLTISGNVTSLEGENITFVAVVTLIA